MMTRRQMAARLSLADRLAALSVQLENGCREWTGGRNLDGYGQLSIHRKQMGAHRLAYELHHGPIAPGLNVCHTCDNRACINPAHLWLGTQRQNIHDARGQWWSCRDPSRRAA